MNDKFSLYQTDGLWGIIENTSNEKQTSIKSYFGSDLIIKRLNEQDQQIDRLKQQLAEKQKTIDEINKEFVQAIHDWKALCAEKDKKIELLNAMISTLPEHDKEIKEYELEKVKNYFIEECEDGDGIKTEDRVIKKDIYEVADFIENQIKELKGQDND